jgi:Glycosyltransferase family 87
MRIPPIPRRARLWLVWLLVVFGALNVFGPPLEAWRLPGDAETIDWNALPARQTQFERLMTTLRGFRDVERYFAYAEATLGRPYRADFVLAPGSAGSERPPDSMRIVTPQRPLVPWRDFTVEYPPGMMIAVLPPALVTRDAETYFRLFALEMEAALTLAVWLSLRTAERLRPGAGDGALDHATLLTLALGVIAVRRYDPTVALTIAAAVHALAARRPAASGAALGFAVALKGVPILLAPIFVLHALASGRAAGPDRRSGRSAARDPASLGGRRGRDALAFLFGLGAILAVAGLAYGLVAGAHFFDAFAYHARRPLQIQSLYSGVLIAARSFDPAIMSGAIDYGSLNAVSPVEPALRALSTVLMLAGIVASWAFAWARLRAAHDETGRLIVVLQASLACLIAFITLGKVFSPQYCVWLIPLAAAVAPFAGRAARRFLPVAFLLVQAEFPFFYALLYATPIPAAGALIAVRTVWLWGYIGAALRPRLTQSAEAIGSAVQISR